MTPSQLLVSAHAPCTSTMVGLAPPLVAAASTVRADAIWLSGMAKLAMATITAAMMSRSLTGCAIRVMFTEVSFPGVPGARADARLCGYQAVTSADRSACGWFPGSALRPGRPATSQDAALVRCRVTSYGLSLRLEPSGGVSAGLLHFPAGTRPAGGPLPLRGGLHRVPGLRGRERAWLSGEASRSWWRPVTRPRPALLHAVQRWLGMFAQVLHPGPLHAWVVRGSLDQIHEVGDVRVEPLLQLLVGDAPFSSEGPVGPGQGEHVRIQPRAEVLKRDAQRPQAAVAAAHRRRCGHEQPVPLVERLRLVAGYPVDGVLQRPRHRRVVLR